MAFFNKKSTSQQASTVSPNGNTFSDTSNIQTQQVKPQAGNTLEFNSNANDTFNDNYQPGIDLNQDIQVKVDTNGLKSVTPKMAFEEPGTMDVQSNIQNNLPNNLAGGPMGTLPPLDLTPQAEGLDYVNYSLDQILLEAINSGASDVHLTVGYRAVIRVDGILKTFKSTLLTPEITLEYAKQFISRRKDLKLEDIHEADLTYALEDRRFRVNIYRQMGVFSIACRVIPERISTLEDLNLPSILKEFTKFPNGLVLVTGPTGSGKSTTIASILNNINLTQSKHITSIEDPVEYVFPKAISLIDQREFGIDFTSWTTALRSILRQDPDIVFLGEMRDYDSIEAALQIADTGHLVFATLHTNGAAQSIDRIIDVFPAERQSQIRVQLASVIRAVVSQRLVGLATKGRTPVAEILIANAAVKNAIRENKVFLIDNIIQTSSDEGMISMEKSLASLVKRGTISINTAKSLSLRPKEIDILLHQ